MCYANHKMLLRFEYKKIYTIYIYLKIWFVIIYRLFRKKNIQFFCTHSLKIVDCIDHEKKNKSESNFMEIDFAKKNFY